MASAEFAEYADKSANPINAIPTDFPQTLTSGRLCGTICAGVQTVYGASESRHEKSRPTRLVRSSLCLGVDLFELLIVLELPEDLGGRLRCFPSGPCLQERQPRLQNKVSCRSY